MKMSLKKTGLKRMSLREKMMKKVVSEKKRRKILCWSLKKWIRTKKEEWEEGEEGKDIWAKGEK